MAVAVPFFWGLVGLQRDEVCGVSWAAQATVLVGQLPAQEAPLCTESSCWPLLRVLGSESLLLRAWVWLWLLGTSTLVCRARLSAAQARNPEDPCPSWPGRQQPAHSGPAQGQEPGLWAISTRGDVTARGGPARWRLESGEGGPRVGGAAQPCLGNPASSVS